MRFRINVRSPVLGTGREDDRVGMDLQVFAKSAKATQLAFDRLYPPATEFGTVALCLQTHPFQKLFAANAIRKARAIMRAWNPSGPAVSVIDDNDLPMKSRKVSRSREPSRTSADDEAMRMFSLQCHVGYGAPNRSGGRTHLEPGY